eukprot:11967043-Alexandrium_andersonii.AAC.1
MSPWLNPFGFFRACDKQQPDARSRHRNAFRQAAIGGTCSNFGKMIIRGRLCSTRCMRVMCAVFVSEPIMKNMFRGGGVFSIAFCCSESKASLRAARSL